MYRLKEVILLKTYNLKLKTLLDNVFSFQLINNLFDSLLGCHLVHLARSLHGLGEGLEHLGGRTSETQLAFLDIDLVGTPDLNFLIIGLLNAAHTHVAGIEG